MKKTCHRKHEKKLCARTKTFRTVSKVPGGVVLLQTRFTVEQLRNTRWNSIRMANFPNLFPPQDDDGRPEPASSRFEYIPAEGPCFDRGSATKWCSKLWTRIGKGIFICWKLNIILWMLSPFSPRSSISKFAVRCWSRLEDKQTSSGTSGRLWTNYTQNREWLVLPSVGSHRLDLVVDCSGQICVRSDGGRHRTGEFTCAADDSLQKANNILISIEFQTNKECISLTLENV